MLKNLLIYRFVVFNLICICGMAAAAGRGILGTMYEQDTSGLVVAIVGLFLVVWVGTVRKILYTSHILNYLKKFGRDALTIPLSPEKVWAKLEWLRDASGWLVGLGLIGTVVGFSVALSGVNTDSLASAGGTGEAVVALMRGMRIALTTTIAGAVLGMWNEVNQRMLRTAVSCMLEDGK